MPQEFLLKHRNALVGGLLSAGCLGWCFFVDFKMGPVEFCRVLAGLVALWLPIGSLVYLLLRDRCSDTLMRCTLSAAASYALTAPAYTFFGVCDLKVPGFQSVFYVVQALMLVGAVAYALRHKQHWQTANLVQVWRKLDWVLIVLISLSILVTARYKTAYEYLENQNVRLIGSGDSTYLTSCAYELGRQTPAAQQSVRAGIKERAYHMYPHLTAMLVARYTGEPDIYLAMTRFNFTLVEILLCLIIFCLVRRVTASRAAGYAAVAVLYIFAIPLPPIGPHFLNYFYFNFYPHATSNIEPSIYCSPQTYLALPAIFGAMLFVLQLSVQLSQRRKVGTVAVLAGLMVAVLIRFRVQSFMIFFPGFLLLLGIMLVATRKWALAAAGVLATLAAAAQVLEMKLPLYYPESASILLQNNFLARDCAFMKEWPGAGLLQVALDSVLHPNVFNWTWQIVGLGMFALLNMAGIPVVTAGLFHFFRCRTWQADTWAYSAMVAWLVIGTVIGATFLCTPYDTYSIGGQSLFLIGWYMLPLLAIGFCQAGSLLPRRLSPLNGYAAVAAVLLILAAGSWQRVRPNSRLQKVIGGGVILRGEEYLGMVYMRSHLPADAVLLTRASHHPRGGALISGIAGRACFLEYFPMGGPLGGGPQDQWYGRIDRVDRVWDADDAEDFTKAVLDTGATHLIEYADQPLEVHPRDCLEEFWTSPTGAVRVWTFRASPTARLAARVARKRFDPAGEAYRTVGILSQNPFAPPFTTNRLGNIAGSPAVLATGQAAH